MSNEDFSSSHLADYSSCKTHQTNSNAFCASSKRKRKANKNKDEFSEARKKHLAAADLGSWYDQEKQWPEEFEKNNKLVKSPSTSGV